MNWKRWIVIGLTVGVVAVVGGPWVYIHLVSSDAPAPLTASASGEPVANTSAKGSTDGEWTVADGSVVGYRVNEVLFGQTATAVGRTQDVTGTLQAQGTKITAASFTADMTTVTSDKERRDAQFQGRIMNTATYPTSSFELTEAITFSAIPAAGTSVTKTVAGKLTLHGTTKTVNVDVTGSRSSGGVSVKGSIPIVFAEWNIPSPSFGPVTTEDHGVLEFALNFTRA
jgi:polyisoprenoid-binding protein YceI